MRPALPAWHAAHSPPTTQLCTPPTPPCPLWCSDTDFADLERTLVMQRFNLSRGPLRLKLPPPPSRPPPPRSAPAGRKLLQALPDAWDWRTLGVNLPVKAQNGCGSCWAFAALAALESRAVVQKLGDSFDTSEQQVRCGW